MGSLLSVSWARAKLRYTSSHLLGVLSIYSCPDNHQTSFPLTPALELFEPNQILPGQWLFPTLRTRHPILNNHLVWFGLVWFFTLSLAPWFAWVATLYHETVRDSTWQPHDTNITRHAQPWHCKIRQWQSWKPLGWRSPLLQKINVKTHVWEHCRVVQGWNQFHVDVLDVAVWPGKDKEG